MALIIEHKKEKERNRKLKRDVLLVWLVELRLRVGG